MRQPSADRGENHGPGKDRRTKELDYHPGIRERPGPIADDRGLAAFEGTAPVAQFTTCGTGVLAPPHVTMSAMTTKQRITTRLPVWALDLLDQVSLETRRPKNDLIAEAVLHWERAGRPIGRA